MAGEDNRARAAGEDTNEAGGTGRPAGFHEFSQFFVDCMMALQSNNVLVGSPKYGTEVYGPMFGAVTLARYTELTMLHTPRSGVAAMVRDLLRSYRSEGLHLTAALRRQTTTVVEEMTHLAWLAKLVPMALTEAFRRFTMTNLASSHVAATKTQVFFLLMLDDAVDTMQTVCSVNPVLVPFANQLRHNNVDIAHPMHPSDFVVTFDDEEGR